ncbi:TorD/DmsD family molecular chaperone [Limisalsivibrio acetivorans]|uniref:TorD/DmsD family molecular chaperone n=1 Tax=Limisalsivibrio acetivorans TaxID=1304888 RepID=UPI0003B5AC70|nr:molecular chaperone TorD family protein [Limisalsivibrio acetivorans]
METSELVSLNRGRDVIFNYLSQCFGDIPQKSFEEMGINIRTFIKEIADNSGNEDMSKGADLMCATFASIVDMSSEQLEEHRLKRSKDYTKLFMLGKGIIPYTESAYSSEERMIKQEPWKQVKRIYADNKLKIVSDRKELEDHIAIELLFMGTMSKKSADAFEADDFDTGAEALQTQLGFYETHLNRWAGSFCNDIIGRSDELLTDFYVGAALFMRGYLAEDYSFLKELLED